jgi:hypothetical protein
MGAHGLVPKRFQNEKIPRKNFDDANNMVAKTEILKMIASGEVNKKVQNEKIPRKNFGARCVGLAHLVPKVPGIMVGVPPSKQGGV